jgi:DNA-binding IclR family transcriptional regulator
MSARTAKAGAQPPRRGLSSVTNALSVLAYLVEADEAGVSEIARHVGVTVGTAHRLVATLVATGFAEQNPNNRRYRPTQKLVAMAQKMRNTISPREIAHRHLTELVSRVHETGNLAILDQSLVLYVDKVTSEQPFGIEARVGSRLPAYCTALGKVLVANLDEAGKAKYLKTLRKRDQAPVPPPVGAFRAEIEEARANGFALDLGEYLPDIYCVAAPVRGKDGVVAAMSVSVPRSRFEKNREQLVDELKKAAGSLSETLQDLGLPDAPHEFAAPRSD